ncbi:MAG: hypothetical protein GXX99_03585 [Clostridiales bacterium]|nr:hypothetical protein [Clostridiales bacterium]
MRQVQLGVDRRSITAGSMLLGALLYVLLGGLLLSRHQVVISVFLTLAGTALALFALIGLLSFLFGRKNEVRQLRQLFSALLSLGGVWVVFSRPSSLLALLPLMLGANALLSGLLYLASCFLQRKNNEWVSSGYVLFGSLSVLFGSLSVLFGLALIFSPVAYISTSLNIAGIYCLLAAITQFQDFLEARRPVRADDHCPPRRRLRFSRPSLLTALVPKRQQGKVSRQLRRETADDPPAEPEELPSLEIFVHATEKGLGTIGHVDICYEDTVYTYGPYDKASHRLRGVVCRGVLAVVQGRERYLEFCTLHSRKTIFCYGIALSEAQRRRLEQGISELMTEVVIWHSPHRLDPQGRHDDYASLLQQYTDAQLYHFARGRFHTYFMGGANCTLLSDRLVGPLGIDALHAGGILTPGAYFNYLDREHRRPNSPVISRRIYCAAPQEIEQFARRLRQAGGQ